MKSPENTILVVEDDLDTRRAICTMLEALGYGVLDYGTAHEALRGIKTQRVDLALLDIMMPEMSGYELLEKMKQTPGFQEVPVIMVTAKDEGNEILEGYQLGADYYITKPFTSKQLEYGIRLFLREEDGA